MRLFQDHAQGESGNPDTESGQPSAEMRIGIQYSSDSACNRVAFVMFPLAHRMRSFHLRFESEEELEKLLEDTYKKEQMEKVK